MAKKKKSEKQTAIRLTPSMDKAINREAKRLGIAPITLIRRLVAQGLGIPDDSLPRGRPRKSAGDNGH